ncbi:hypothetical protein P152DRAFT_470084 [Eremomyces bilateralis CBS 781.70]|uniref:Uncharacterized protein n=1 Tax=Eremomyces bilateralis CBS 781.70 TaxID=1392243 RepID=A0A6G1GDN2_9PEZI|nr:uncharacterized protein P152DRAFT_470084 [Eremomyces bilateralis CBS 781.70]KAF1816016.1 hypothetical protein P152DRAFT_470084 [Eremomyces bilateralis CBS 781.70]
MAQGAIKKSAAQAKKGQKSASTTPKRGSRIIAPKKAKLIQKKKLMKKHSGGLCAVTEERLGAKAGHLELLRVGKNAKKGEKKGPLTAEKK